MKPRPATGRRLANGVVSVLSTLSAVLGMVILAWIIGVVVSRGLGAFNLDFFTQLPTPPGEGRRPGQRHPRHPGHDRAGHPGGGAPGATGGRLPGGFGQGSPWPITRGFLPTS